MRPIKKILSSLLYTVAFLQLTQNESLQIVQNLKILRKTVPIFYSTNYFLCNGVQEIFTYLFIDCQFIINFEVNCRILNINIIFNLCLS